MASNYRLPQGIIVIFEFKAKSYFLYFLSRRDNWSVPNGRLTVNYDNNLILRVPGYENAHVFITLSRFYHVFHEKHDTGYDRKRDNVSHFIKVVALKKTWYYKLSILKRVIIGGTIFDRWDRYKIVEFNYQPTQFQPVGLCKKSTGNQPCSNPHIGKRLVFVKPTVIPTMCFKIRRSERGWFLQNQQSFLL